MQRSVSSRCGTWAEFSKISQRAPLMPSAKGCTTVGVASSWRPEISSTGTLMRGSWPMIFQPLSVPMT
jgi:hypothetical protein